MLRGMENEELTPPTPADTGTPEPGSPELGSPELATPTVRSEEALARSKDEVTPRFKEPKAQKKTGRWTPGRTVGNRPTK